jgi:hypothetical protein
MDLTDGFSTNHKRLEVLCSVGGFSVLGSLASHNLSFISADCAVSQRPFWRNTLYSMAVAKQHLQIWAAAPDQRPTCVLTREFTG